MTETAEATVNATTSAGSLSPANEPLAIAAIIRAALYTWLLQRGMDASTVAVVCTVTELVLTAVTRRFVTPVRRADQRVADAVAAAT